MGKIDNFQVEKTLRNLGFWLCVVMFSWLLSFIWLGSAALYPVVFIVHFVGFCYLFPQISDLIESVFKLIHFGHLRFQIISLLLDIFFVVFLIYIKKISKNFLYILSIFFLLMIVLSLVGCSQVDYGQMFS